MKSVLFSIALMAFGGRAVAQDSFKIDNMKVFRADTLNWRDDPALPKGGQSVLLLGEPTKSGMFVVRVKFPPHFKVAPHTHPFAEFITVISGSLGNGMGDVFDTRQCGILKAGSSFALPAKHAHFVW